MLVYVCAHILIFFSIYWSDTSLLQRVLWLSWESVRLGIEGLLV